MLKKRAAPGSSGPHIEGVGQKTVPAGLERPEETTVSRDIRAKFGLEMTRCGTLASFVRYLNENFGIETTMTEKTGSVSRFTEPIDIPMGVGANDKLKVTITGQRSKEELRAVMGLWARLLQDWDTLMKNNGLEQYEREADSIFKRESYRPFSSEAM